MKTNEEIKEALLDLTEKAVEELVGHIEGLKEGDLDQLEQTVFKAIMEFGRTALEEYLFRRGSLKSSALSQEGSTYKSKIPTGKRGSILPSLEERIERAMRYATKSVETKRGNTDDPESRREPNPRLSTPSQP